MADGQGGGSHGKYLLRAGDWETFQSFFHSPFRLVARHHDLYTGGEVVLVTNENEAGRPQAPVP